MKVMGKYRSKYVIDESSCFVLVGMRYRYEYIHCVEQITWMLSNCMVGMVGPALLDHFRADPLTYRELHV